VREFFLCFIFACSMIFRLIFARTMIYADDHDNRRSVFLAFLFLLKNVCRLMFIQNDESYVSFHSMV